MPKLVVVVLFLCTAVAIVSVFLAAPVDPFGVREFPMREHPVAQIALMASPLLFLLASALVLFRPRLGYTVALFAGLVAFSCFMWIELSRSPWANAWIALNLPDGSDAWGREYVVPAKLSILSVVLTVTSMVLSVLRVLPASWTFRESPVRERTWPVFAVPVLVLAVWFGCSVMPYRLPGMLHMGVGPDLRILHVEKRGLQIHETAVAVFRDGRFGIEQTNRALFQYRFTGHGAIGVMPHTLMSRAMALARSLQLNGLHTPRAKALRAWNAEGWYVLCSESLLAFTSEYGSEPPREVVDLFRDIEKLPVTDPHQGEAEKDICLGFCYGPPAALGFVYANHYCYTYEDGSTRCR
jgi:hypothetical protein